MSTFVSEFILGGDGKRVAVKDSIDIAGYPTRCGTRALADAAPAECNAFVVDAVLNAGWQIVGKTNLHELAFGVTGINDWTGTPVNPMAPDRVPGGSSSGSASAVAAGLADIALGTDTGGSVRVPAACCGIAGLKPTFGRVSRDGVHPAQSSLDCVGPFAANMADLIAASLRVRDWVNTPTEDMGPQQLEDAARDLVEAHGGELEVIAGDELLEMNFPTIHAVGRASHRAPRLIVLRWG
uniref:amidase family protein n=1 Tax=Pseudomonas nitroreducens TaxID=46680 RepID=UPI0028AB14C1